MSPDYGHMTLLRFGGSVAVHKEAAAETLQKVLGALRRTAMSWGQGHPDVIPYSIQNQAGRQTVGAMLPYLAILLTGMT
ncbi:hypothetical protein H9L39_18472 [Fusarium oxysporum f. sp. albedinis]|nr:hypothetical protein H9L39_18472 [Fusarium oxysporum f. sp. albedinis]